MEFLEYETVFSVQSDEVNYLRLKQTDFDGSYTYSDVINLDNSAAYQSDLKIKLADGVLWLYSQEKVTSITVFDLYGRPLNVKDVSEKKCWYVESQSESTVLVNILFANNGSQMMHFAAQ
jgi:hypothetical protein